MQSQPGLLALGAALSALTVLMGMALLGVAGWFITATALAGLQAASALAFDVFAPSAAIRLLAVGRTASRYGERLVTHDATLAVSAALRERLFLGLATPLSARRLLARPARALHRLTGDVDALESLYLRGVVPGLAALGAAMLMGIVAGFFDAWLGACLAVALLVGGWGIAVATGMKAMRPSMARGLRLERLRSSTVDLVAGQAELLMAGRLQSQCDRLVRVDQRMGLSEGALHRLETRAGLAYGALGSLLLAGVLLAAAWLAESKAIEAPMAALLLLLALGAVEPFAAMRRGAVELGRSLLAVRRIAPSLEDGQYDGHAATVPMPAPATGSAVVLQGLSISYPGSGLPAIRAVDLQVHVGERVALIGASGSGKSTLLNAIAGELKPSLGSAQALPASWLTQRTELFSDSLRDNLLLAAPASDDARLWSALESAGLAGQVCAMADGLDTPLGEGGLGLSGGQSRRLALARLLLRDSPLWLLDEPTEGMDTRAAHDVLSRMKERLGERTLVLATHLRREAELADRLLRIEHGRLTEEAARGTPAFDAMLRTLRPD
ncbi:ATP-binding cassette domain-containing protein [Variovorax dokdonensis]|uniref:ATP-binding cassette domain-containing protein n=2 Tax=Variovorax dokdonensis TaxID=344883 RepID=A0ABT7NDT0_9BURK|nr:ATP-binding cassette domain-containing protein [Variovorax dokdonensis]MDM0046110.1 ATP-binding cassette domain-containing protein [Variovorax dokdonensis]